MRINFTLKKGLVFLLFLFVSVALHAQIYPHGFSQEVVTNNINNPTNFSFAPDGRIFVCEQTGKLRVIKNGVLLQRAFISLQVDASGERGLLGVAFSPNFATDQLVYLYYTKPNGANNRVVRVKANGDTAIKSTMQTVLDLDPLSSATNHNGGSIHFGNDGKLYIAAGENANGANAQNLDTYLGKLLRVNPDGSVPAGNPYPTGSEQRKRVWCYGLRNPYTFSVDDLSGKIYVNDVGQSTYEEVNDATTSKKNFGWPNAEGNSNNGAYTNPVIIYKHSGNADKTGCAITGGTFFTSTSTNYPAKFQNNYYYLDLCGNWINRFSLSAPSQRYVFATSIAGSNVGMATGPDGNLYFLSRDNGALYRIVYNPGFDDAITKNINASINIFPSPANTSLTIETNNFNTGKTFIKIIDERGAVVKQQNASAKTTTINTSNFQKGFYFIIVSDGVQTSKTKVEVIH